MNDVVDVVMTNGEPLAVVASEEQPIDLLNRQGIIDRMLQLVNIISDNRSSCSIALNGSWGCGKTFVLNKLMKRLLDYRDGEKFLVFHYNCWQYDYYEEPLTAIVAAMLDSVDKETHVFSKSLRDKARRGMELAKPVLETLAKEFVKKKFGIDLSEAMKVVKGGADSLKLFEKMDKDLHEYDECYAFKKIMSAAQESICALGKDRTLVIIVDELDRCLPGYAIKVMERLHHLFAGIQNVAVILAVDKDQLEQTVKQIFGDNVNTTRYLKKFINIELCLDVGRIESGFAEKYADYVGLFDELPANMDFSFGEYISALFADIDVRTQEHIMERIKLVHTMLFPGVKKDHSFMCFELMWMVFVEKYGELAEMPIVFDSRTDKLCFTMRDSKMPVFSMYLQKSWGHLSIGIGSHGYPAKEWYVFGLPIDTPKLLIWYLSQMFQSQYIVYRLEGTEIENKYKQNIVELKEVIALLNLIK